ncbi:hypothetical protein AVEN_239436-1 [Araneus ventricosus]|uniref:Uncharacterized protein n=1 Tax=Araneus ventricosus TaxID=182803 RepID=A0A4Y2HAJ6_ARAVE|nr:hypothetical protein AVEN_239436-1 [Araneus ventricosus]
MLVRDSVLKELTSAMVQCNKVLANFRTVIACQSSYFCNLQTYLRFALGRDLKFEEYTAELQNDINRVFISVEPTWLEFGENHLGLCLDCKVDAVALTNQTFHLFGPLKHHLGGKHFADDDDAKHEVLLWMRQQLKELYAAGIGALIKHWDKCINIGGDYVEK